MSSIGSAACGALAHLGAVLPVDPARLTDAQLVGLVEDIEAVARHVEALRLATAAELAARSAGDGADSLAHRLGFKTAAGALQGITRSSGREAAKLVADARDLAQLPAVEEAVRDGRIGRESAAAIAGELKKATASPADAGDVATAAVELVELAATAGADEVRAKRAMEERFFWVGPTKGGVAKVSGLLPAGHAAVIRGVLDAFSNPRGRKSVTFAPAEEATPGDARRAGQKNADLLRDIFAAQARAAEAPDLGGDHPTVWISTTAKELESGEGMAFYAGTAEPVPVSEAAQAACAGGVQPVIFDEDGDVLRLGHAVRGFTKRQRRAIALRDGGTCLIPGCTVPAPWCEVHHVTPHRAGGKTDVANGVLLCWWHHHDIDTGPWQIRMRGGTPEVRYAWGGTTRDWAPAGDGAAARLKALAPPRPLRPPGGSPS